MSIVVPTSDDDATLAVARFTAEMAWAEAGSDVTALAGPAHGFFFWAPSVSTEILIRCLSTRYAAGGNPSSTHLHGSGRIDARRAMVGPGLFASHLL